VPSSARSRARGSGRRGAPRRSPRGRSSRTEASIATEIELKLAARPRDLPALTRALEARAAAGEGSRPARLISTYFDTSDHALARRGLALRVRECDGRFIQTVKSHNRNGAGAFARGEWEDPIGDARPDPQAAASGRFLGPDIAARLVPLFRTEVSRRTVELMPAPGTRIAAAIDRGRVCRPAGEAGEPISEVELELQDGPATALYDVALDLLAVAPVRLERRSKAERGYRLTAADAAPPGAVRAAPVELAPQLSGNQALRRIGIACLDQLLRNEPAVLAGVAEGIHQMRVAVRRLRAMLAAFGRMLPSDQRRRATAELRWLADALSTVRNLDVFEQALLAPAWPVLAESEGLAALTVAVRRRHDAADARATRAIRSRRYTALLLRLLRWFDGCLWQDAATSPDLAQPITVIAARILARRRRLAKRRSKGFAKQSPEQRHRLRIALKKLRYATEMLAGLYDAGAVERFTRRLKRLQDDLGDANDLRVARDIIADLAKPAPGASGDDAGIIVAAGNSLLQWHERRLAAREPQLRKHLDGLLAAEPFWTR